MSTGSPNSHLQTGLRRYVGVVIAFTVLLIWWGAATTTEKAGMVFADWPLSLGSVNPDGWLSNMAPFLEHIHRLTATLVGFLTLGLFIWVYGAKSKLKGLEVFGLVVVLAVIFGIFIASGRERVEVDRKRMFLLTGLIVSLLPIAWMIWSSLSRGWELLEKLAALALLMVTAQAIFGGLRVTEISDAWAVFHGCFAHLFFCVLILIALMLTRRWNDEPPSVSPEFRSRLSIIAIVGVVMVVTQLALGAYIRHHHRFGLADTGIITTTGKLIPAFEDPIITVMFLHKVTAVFILVYAVSFFFWLKSCRTSNRLFSKLQTLVVVLILVQVGLGISVIMTGKSFWVTNFHVLNGLAILAASFSISAWAFRGKNEVLIAAQSD